MIFIKSLPLSPAAQSDLNTYQTKINSLPSYADKVAQAKADFKAKNTKTNATFQEVRNILESMSAGACRCMYCEDSCADEIEHIKPKHWYPEATFIWDNYLYACGICNRKKSSNYAVFNAVTGQKVALQRAKNGPVIPPQPGNPMLLDPRFELVMEFIILDVRGTFQLVPHPKAVQFDQDRAHYTIETLFLNRDLLLKARRDAFDGYYARLHEYVSSKSMSSTVDMKRLENALLNVSHPTVWKEMQRQHSLIPKLKSLFDQAPEALTW